MRYVLDKGYRLRGYTNLTTGLHDVERGLTQFFERDQYRLLLDCDGLHDLAPDAMDEESATLLQNLERAGVIHPAGLAEMLSNEQMYVRYPARYTRSVHWSITGDCNLKCRHCFMSAPEGKHGAPTWDQLVAIVDQLCACGIHRVELTGGEPLIRTDFLDLLDLLDERQIRVGVIYTNGWLVDERLLDELDARLMHPSFQLSFDGVGRHDFLRGVDGAEERCLHALELLQQRAYTVSVSMCLHRQNVGTIRQTVRRMAELGVAAMKISPAFELGDWAQPELRELYLDHDEALEAFCAYIPQFFEDDAPLEVSLEGSFVFRRLGDGSGRWLIGDEVRVRPQDEATIPSCGILKSNFYVSASGRMAPCMGMDDCAFAEGFPNLLEEPLSQILGSDAWRGLTDATVGEVRDANPVCRACRFQDRCIGGCRYHALLDDEDDYLGISHDLCHFFQNGWDERVRAAAEPAYAAWCARHGVEPVSSSAEWQPASEDGQPKDLGC